MSRDLKTCPFCGCLPVWLDDSENYELNHSTDCPLYLILDWLEDDDEEIEYWNRRTKET